jgi:long-chain acyl-CoA synthetase
LSGADRFSPYARKPWLALYSPGAPAELAPDMHDGLSLFRAAVFRAAEQPAKLYFDGALTYADLDRLSDGLAAALVSHGFARGDRLAVFMQNMPQFLIAMLGAWKAGGIVAPVNPISRQREVALIFEDCRPKALVCLDALYDDVIATLPAEAPRPDIVFTTSALSLQSHNDSRVFNASVARQADERAPLDLLAAIEAAANLPRAPEPAPAADDIAFLVYTSGTTGLPKAAMNTHGAFAFNAHAIAAWYALKVCRRRSRARFCGAC